MRTDFNSVDYVGNHHYVFDMKGNNYRLNIIMYRSVVFLIIVLLLFPEGCAMISVKRAKPSDGVKIDWDEGSERKIKESGTYARIIRCADGRYWIAFEDLQGNVVVSHSDDCHTWSEDRIVFPRKFESGSLVKAANAEIIELDNGVLVCGANYRPVSQGMTPYSIAVSRSFDNGLTWERPRILYEAGTFFKDGCWEPSFLQLPDGTLQLYFANESPYRESDEQEISLLESEDKGDTWTAEPRTVSFRKDHRDGMPVAEIFGDDIVLVIEDNYSGDFKPYTVRTSLSDNWNIPVYGNSTERHEALVDVVSDSTYMGAPYLLRLPSGEAVISYQTNEKRSHDRELSCMEVAIGDSCARNFTNRSRPFDIPENKSGKWNSLMLLNDSTIMAVCSSDRDGHPAIWVKEGHILKESR